jgi:hypothetical protein
LIVRSGRGHPWKCVHPRKFGHPLSSVLGIVVVNGCVILVQCCPCCLYNVLESFASCAVVPPMAPVIVLTHSANACITLSAWVVVGSVIFLCLKWTVSEWHLLLVALTHKFSLPLGSYVETCTSFYIFSGLRWLVGWIGYWTPIKLPHCLSASHCWTPPPPHH